MPVLIVVEIIAQVHRDPECAARVARSDRRMMRGVADLVERLQESGLADPGLAPETVARWILTITDGFYGRGYPEPDRDRAADVATAKRLIAHIPRHPESAATS